MPPDPDARLRAFAAVVVRVGLNLQPGQPLLVTDPYGLQGVHPDAMNVAAAVEQAAGAEMTVIPADSALLRRLAGQDDLAGFESLVRRHVGRLERHLARGGAFLFLPGTTPQLFAGMPDGHAARFEAAKWRHLGPLMGRLLGGATQWTAAPAPTPDWARAAGTEIAALWDAVAAALRLDAPDPLADWRIHLAGIGWQREQFNQARHRSVRFAGPGTDLRLALPRFHRWCTAQQKTRGGVEFLANLPAEEIFTAPHARSAEGSVRVRRPVSHAGVTIRGLELEFTRGRVARARADEGQDALDHLLATDAGAVRLGEVALVPGKDRLPWAAAAHHHLLLDENATHHVALGDAYRSCSRAWLPLALNRSLLHLDLPLDAEAELS